MTTNQYGTYKVWTDEEEFAIISMYGTASIGQIAEFLGRSKGATKLRINKMRKMKRFDKKPNFQRRNPFTITRTAILVAKTCIGCGRLMSADNFWKVGQHQYDSYCKTCKSSNNVDNQSKRHHISDPVANEYQRISLMYASRRGEPITEDDIAIINDITKTNLEAAIKSNRTYYSIVNSRYKFNASKKKFPIKETGEWIIQFPKAMEALQQYYIRLGVPDDGWDEVA
jgi:hypothetical protein